MPSLRHSNAAFRPISAGNAITLAVVLYRSHLWQYLRISGIATAWAMCPFLVAGLLVAAGLLLVTIGSSFNFAWALALILGIPAWLFLLMWCMAKSLRNLGLMSRLAYNDLASQPETPQQARRHLRTAWWFLLAQFLVGLILQGVSMVMQIGFMLLVWIMAAIADGIGIGSWGEWIQGGSTLVISLGLILTYFWVLARFFLPEVPLSVEAKTDGVTAVGRSWTLSQGSATRIMIALSIATAIVTPLYLLSFTPLIIALGVGASLLTYQSMANTELAILLTGLFVLLLILSILLVNLIVMPFWQALKSVLYYDLRVRKEGLGLSLTDLTSPALKEG